MYPFMKKSAGQGVRPTAFALESLENRRLLSAEPAGLGTNPGSLVASQVTSLHHSDSSSSQSITFGAAPAAVQTGLDALAGTTLPSTQQVRVRTLSNNTTHYATLATVNGNKTLIAVDANGNPLQGVLQFSKTPSAVQSGLQALAGSTAIPATQQVQIRTLASGTTVYATIVSVNGRNSKIAVDSSGNPLFGTISFSNAPSAVKTALQAQAGSTTIAGTQSVQIHTLGNGTTVYSTVLSANGEQTFIAVDSNGNTITKLSHGGSGSQQTIQFSSAPQVVQTALQTAAAGATIPATQTLAVHTLNGTTVYSTEVAVNGQQTDVAADSTGRILEGVIQFGAAPAAVRTGLQALAPGLTIPATQLVHVNAKGTTNTIYSTTVTLNGQATEITVDSTGKAVGAGDHGTQPTTITFGSAPTAVQTGLQALAPGITIPASQVLQVFTLRNGTTIYATTVTLSGQPTQIAVDATGKAVTEGEHQKPNQQTIQFSSAPAAVQTGLQALAGTTTIPATQQVRVFTLRSGTTVYVTSVSSTGEDSEIAVDSNGNPIKGTIQFSAAPAVVQTGLKALATGVTIPATQPVEVFSEFNGKTIYATSVTINGQATEIAVDSTGAAVGRFGGHGTGRHG